MSVLPPSRAAVFALAVALAGCASPRARPGDAPPDTAKVPAREAWGVRFSVTEDGLTRVRFAAAHLAAYETDSLYTRLDGVGPDGRDAGVPVTVQLFDATGAPTATLTARSVVYLEATRRFIADGAVSVRTAGGRTLSAERVVWDDAAGRVRAPGAVRYTSPTERVEGLDLDASSDLTAYTLRHVTAQLTLAG